MRTHLSLRTRRIDESVEFYRSLLNADPRKHYADYALFLTDQPGLELALDLDDAGPGEIEASHFGIAVDAPVLVDEAIARLQSAGLPVDVHKGETCCYARQDKVWTTDPDGRRWEVYYVSEETAIRDDASTCCAHDTCETYETCCGAEAT